MQHCDRKMVVCQRGIKPTVAELQRGVQWVDTCVYWCANRECPGKYKIYYKRELFENGYTDWQRVKRSISAFVSRLRLAKDSDWVWGYHPETFAKVKRTVQ